MRKKVSIFIFSTFIIYILIICYVQYNIKVNTENINEKYKIMSQKNNMEKKDIRCSYTGVISDICKDDALDIINIENDENNKVELINIECSYSGKLQDLPRTLENIKNKENFNNIKLISIEKENSENVIAKIKFQFLKKIKQ